MDEKLKIQKDLLWELFQEYRTHARHKEIMRANITNYLIIVSAGLITLITYDNVKVDKEDYPMTIMLIILGILGILFSASYTERYHRNKGRADKIAELIGNDWFDDGEKFVNLKKESDHQHELKPYHKLVARISNSHILWLLFPVSITMIGFILTFLAWKTSTTK